MKKNTQSPYSRSAWTAILETSRVRAGDVVFEKMRQQKKLGSILRSSYHSLANESTFHIEKEDVSPQLSVLKTSLDVHRSRFASSENKIFNLKLENSRVKELFEEAQQKLDQLHEKSTQVKSSIEKVKEKQENESDTRKSLFHVFDRMRTTLVFLKEKKRIYWENIHVHDFSLDSNKKKSTKTKDSLSITHQAFEVFQNSVIVDLSMRENDLKDLKSNVETMQRVAQDRDDHANEEKVMSEQIFLNDQGAALDQLRRQFFSHFIWNMLSSQHFEREKIKYKVYEEAYAKIKIATGISDVPHFVDKFLTQEQRYNDFLLAVKTKEEKVLEIKENIQNMQNLINDFSSSNQLSETSDRRDSNMFRLTQKKLVESLFKYKRLKMIRKKISDWIRRLVLKFEGSDLGESESLLFLMNSLKTQMFSKLQSSRSTLQSTIWKQKHQKNSEIIENLMKSRKNL